MKRSTLPHALRRSLRLRLLIGTLSWIVISILLAGWGLGQMFQRHVEAQLASELRNHLDQLTAQLRLDTQGNPAVPLPPGDPRLHQPLSGLYWQIDGLASSGSPAMRGLLRSRSLWDETLNVPNDNPIDGEIHHHQILGPQGMSLRIAERSVRLENRILRLMVAADERRMSEPVTDFNHQLWLTLSILGSGLTLAALMQVWMGLAPLHSLQVALSRVHQGNSRQLEGQFPSEIMPLVCEFNRVLAQNTEVVKRAHVQAGDLAHALKTPLSVLTNAALHPAESDTELTRLLIEQIQVMRQQVDYHLSHAQAAAARQIPGLRTVVAPVIAGLIRVMQRVHAERKLSFELRMEAKNATLAFRGEEQDLQEMLGNLLDNAAKWASSRIEIQLSHVGGQLQICIEDDGRGIAPAERQRVLQRGVRADEQVPGSGLGLAISADLALLVGGELRLESSKLGGLQVILTLPKA